MPELDLHCLICRDKIQLNSDYRACSSPKCSRLYHKECLENSLAHRPQCPNCNANQHFSVDQTCGDRYCCEIFLLIVFATGFMLVVMSMHCKDCQNWTENERRYMAQYKEWLEKPNVVKSIVHYCPGSGIAIPSLSALVCHRREYGPLPRNAEKLLDKSNQPLHSWSLKHMKETEALEPWFHGVDHFVHATGDAENAAFISHWDNLCANAELAVIPPLSQIICTTLEAGPLPRHAQSILDNYPNSAALRSASLRLSHSFDGHLQALRYPVGAWKFLDEWDDECLQREHAAWTEMFAAGEFKKEGDGVCTE